MLECTLDYFACKMWLYYDIITNKERDVVGGFDYGTYYHMYKM